MKMAGQGESFSNHLSQAGTPLLGRGSHSFQLWLCEPTAPGHFFPKRQKKLLHFHSNKRQRPEAAGLKGEQPSNSSESNFSEEKPFPASSFPPLPCTATCALPECWAVRISLLMKQSGLRLLSLQSQPELALAAHTEHTAGLGEGQK